MSHPGADPHLANVFEDDSGIRRESGFLRRLTKYEIVKEAEVIPGGYGVCWQRWEDFTCICAPMPWHLVIGAAYRLYHAFRRGVGLVNSREAAAYDRGRRDGLRTEAEILRQARHDFHEQCLLIYESAYANGAKDQLDSLLRELDAQQKGS